MIVRSYNPIEQGLPAIWLNEPIRSSAQVARLARQLRQYPVSAEPIDVVIAGGGGSCSIGLEMYTLLREHPRRKRVTIFDAPSMSGVIAMAGDDIRIAEGGTILLHHTGYARDFLLNEAPSQYLPAAALRALAKGCDATDALHVQIFARRTGLPALKVAELRAAETTLDAVTALTLGFADSIIPNPQEADHG